MMISVMSACLGGLFLICITFIIFLYITARRSRPLSPSPSSSTGGKVGGFDVQQQDGISACIMSDLNWTTFSIALLF